MARSSTRKPQSDEGAKDLSPHAVEFGRRADEIRRAKDIPQKALASALGVQQGTVSKILRGHQTANVKQVAIIAEVLGVPQSDLLPAGYPADDQPASRVSQGEQGSVSDRSAIDPGLAELLSEEGDDISPRERSMLEAIGPRIRPGTRPGKDDWKRVLEAIRAFPPR